MLFKSSYFRALSPNVLFLQRIQLLTSKSSCLKPLTDQPIQFIFYESSCLDSLVISSKTTYHILGPDNLIKPLFIGAKAFIRVAKYNIPFFIYATQTSNHMTTMSTILDQYQEFKMSLRKKCWYFSITSSIWLCH